MILQNPYPKGRWFTVKVKGVPQRVFIKAYGTYDLSTISKDFDTGNLSSQQVVEKFFKRSARQSVLISSNKRSLLNAINQTGKNFFTTAAETLNMISVRVPSLPNNTQQDNVFIYDIEDFYINAPQNVIITYDPSKTISLVKLNGVELLKGSMFKQQDWYIPNVASPVGSPKRFDVSATHLSGKLQEVGNSTTLTAVFEDGDVENFTINCELYYHSATVDTFYAFEISNPSNITANVTWKDAESLISVVDKNNYQLIYNSDYSVEGNTITIFSGYLITFFTEDSKDDFVFNFEKGKSSTKTITATQEFSDGAVILGTGDYFYNAPSDIGVEYTSNYTISNIKYGDVVLQKGTQSHFGTSGDWYIPTSMTLEFSQIAIVSTFLSSYLTNSGDTITLSMNFYDANPVDFTINTDYYYTPATVLTFVRELTPDIGWFDVANPENMVASIAWGDATTLMSIVDGLSYSLVENSDYTLIGDTVTILSTYLSNAVSPPSPMPLTFSFDVGASHITAIGTQQPPTKPGRT